MKVYCFIFALFLNMLSYSQTAGDSSIAGPQKSKILVVPKNEVIRVGENYNADVYLANYDTTKEFSITLGGGLTFKSKDGVARCSIPAYDFEGAREMTGFLATINDSVPRIQSFEAKFYSYRFKPQVTNDMMYILYLGIKNFISVDCPGVEENKYVVSMDGGEIKKAGRNAYFVEVKKKGTVKVTLSYKAETGNGNSIFSQYFRVKEIPTAETKLGTIISGDNCSVNVLLANAEKVLATPPTGMAIDGVEFSVQNFDIRLVFCQAGKDYKQSILGEKLPSEIKEQMRKLKPGDIVVIQNVTVKGPVGEVSANPLFINIK